MSVRLTCCKKCRLNNPEISDAIEKLEHDNPDDLRVVEVKCMAACRQAPAIMVEYDFYPNVTSEELCEVVLSKLTTDTPLETEQTDVMVSY